MTTIRAKVDTELTRRIGTWFTVRDIQDKLRINPSTLKPLIMKYARENVLRRRKIRGTARSVEFSPAANNHGSFKKVLIQVMPYRNFGAAKAKSYGTKKSAKRGKAKKTSSRKSRR